MKKILFLSTMALTSGAVYAMEQMPSQETLDRLLCSDNMQVKTFAVYADARKDYFSGNQNNAYEKLLICANQSIIPWIAREAQEYLQKFEKSTQIQITPRVHIPEATNSVEPKRPLLQIDVQEKLMLDTLNEAADLFYNAKDLVQARQVYRRVLRFTKPGDKVVTHQHEFACNQIRAINEQLAAEKRTKAPQATRDIFK